MSKPIDVPGLRDELDPVHLGHDAGQRGLPTPESPHDPHEHPIVEKIEQLMRDERSSLEDQLEQADKHLKKLHGPEWRGDMNTAQQNAFTRFDDVEQIGSQDLHHKRVEVDKRREDLRKFRQDNRLHREPNYPDVEWQIFSWGVVAVLFLGESIANSVFLAKGNELGVVGAYGVAFGISLANLLPPFFAFGPLSRNTSHVKSWRRLLAWILSLLYIVYAFTLNLGVAHYREVSGRLIGDAGVEVVRRMTQNPLGLQDAESWLLFVLGLIFSLIAFFDGSTSWTMPTPDTASWIACAQRRATRIAVSWTRSAARWKRSGTRPSKPSSVPRTRPRSSHGNASASQPTGAG